MPIYKHNNYDENQRTKSSTTVVDDKAWGNKEEIPHVKLDDSAGNESKVIITDGTNDVGITEITDFTDNLDGKFGVNSAAIMFGRVDADTVVPIKLDGSTQDVQVLEHEHAEIHGSDHYQICDYALNQGNGVTVDFVISVPDVSKWPHLVFEFSGSEGATLEVYLSPTTISGGAVLTPQNNDWNSANTSNLTITKDPTIGADGTRKLGFLAGGSRTSGFASRGRENILKQATVFLFRITSLAVSNDLGWCLEWYEHANKN